MHPAELRRKIRREISAELIEEAGGPYAPVSLPAFEAAKDRRLAGMNLDSREAEAIVAVTWAEVRDDLDRAQARDNTFQRVYLFKNMVSLTHAANVAGVTPSDFAAAATATGHKVTRQLDRKVVRAVLAKCFVRAQDQETKDSIRTAIHVFADEPEGES